MVNLKLCPFHDCLTCGCYDTLEIPDKEWQKRPREDELEKQLKQAKAMVRRLIEAGNTAMALIEIRKSSIHDHEITDSWDVLVAKCNTNAGD